MNIEAGIDASAVPTTTSAAGKLREAGKSARAQKDIIDQVAALEILNDWLAENECP